MYFIQTFFGNAIFPTSSDRQADQTGRRSYNLCDAIIHKECLGITCVFKFLFIRWRPGCTRRSPWSRPARTRCCRRGRCSKRNNKAKENNSVPRLTWSPPRSAPRSCLSGSWRRRGPRWLKITRTRTSFITSWVGFERNLHHSHYYTKRIKEGEGGGGELTLLHTKRKYMYLFPKIFTDVKSSTLNSPHSLFICSAADRSGRSECCSCCCWRTIIDLTK